MNINGSEKYAPILHGLAAALALGACSMVHSQPADEVSTADINPNSSWHANMASPPELAGAVQMSGSASMAPGRKQGTKQIVLKLANTPTGRRAPMGHPCSADEGVFGALENHGPLRVDSKGTGVSNATLAIDTPSTANYFVSVQAFPGNPTLTVAGGNRGAPTT